jgi:hypothetical protein
MGIHCYDFTYLFPAAVDFRHCVTPLLNAEFNLEITPLRHRLRKVGFFQSKQFYIYNGWVTDAWPNVNYVR